MLELFCGGTDSSNMANKSQPVNVGNVQRIGIKTTPLMLKAMLSISMPISDPTTSPPSLRSSYSAAAAPSGDESAPKRYLICWRSDKPVPLHLIDSSLSLDPNIGVYRMVVLARFFGQYTPHGDTAGA